MMRKRLPMAALLVFAFFQCCSNPINNDRFAGTARLTSDTLSSPKAISGGLSTTCASGLAACLTPYAMAGHIYYAAAFVGSDSAYRLGPIIGQMLDGDEATEFLSDLLYDFDVREGTVMAGSPQCCSGESPSYPADEKALLQYLQFYFSHIDVSFILGSDDGVPKAIQGKHTIRLVLANVTGSKEVQGDLLHKGGGEANFRWCTPDGCGSENRPDNPLQDTSIVNYRGVKPYNQIIPEFRLALSPGNPPIKLTKAEMLNTSKSHFYTMNIDVTNGVSFTTNPTSLNGVYDLVKAFKLSAQPKSLSSGFTAKISVTN